MSRHTLMLNGQWDICLDDGGMIAQALGDYAIAQDAANAVRLFRGEAFFDADRGVPHFDVDLGVVYPSMAVIRARIREAALTVEGVESAQPDLEPPDAGRTLSGILALTTDTGTPVTVSL